MLTALDTLDPQAAIRRLAVTGHFGNPSFPDTFDVNLGGFDPDVEPGQADGDDPGDLDNLTLDHPIVKQAVASYQGFMIEQLDPIALHHHMRAAVIDGEVGVATAEVLQMQRCMNPDYRRSPLEAVGTGNWKRCHGIGNFHAATVQFRPSGRPAWMTDEVFKQRIWPQVVRSYEEIGLRFILSGDTQANTSLSFVGSTTGWIGLAIVGRGVTCGQVIWSRYLASYTGGSSLESRIQQWITLFKHELGHNCGLDHSRGGVMNPSIVNGLPVSWRGDPSETLLKQWYGGEPVPGSPAPPDQPGPGPDPQPNPPGPGPRGRILGEAKIVIPAGGLPAGEYKLSLASPIQV